MKAPLEGVRVVEVAHFVAVPAAGALLADLGADVIKVEQPPRGEIYRRTRLQYLGYETTFPEYPPFHMENRGKRSIAIDLKQPQAREALGRIIEEADVFITNLLAGRRRRFGLDHETLLARCPRLVMGAITGYGVDGQEADRPAFDYAAYWARTGMMDAMRDEGLAPSLIRPGVGDHAAAVNLVCGILAALRLRDASGVGYYVDVSLLQTGFHIFGNDVANSLVTRKPVQRHDRRAPINPLWNSYPTADGRWILLVLIDSDRYWPRFCDAIERADLVGDPCFQDAMARSRSAAALAAELETVFAKRSLEEWKPRLDAAGLIWSPVARLEEAIRDPQAREAGCFYEIEHGTAGRFETVAPPFRIHGVPLGARRAASDFDADREAILREVGIDPTRLDPGDED